MSTELPQVKVRIDGEEYSVQGPTSSGAQLKALAHRDARYQVFRENRADLPDELVADHQSIVLEDGMNFYTVPPAMMGTRWI